MEAEVFLPDTIRDVCLYHAERATETPDQSARWIILNEINRAVALYVQPETRLQGKSNLKFDGKETDWRRRLVIGYLFGDVEQPFSEKSSKTLADGQWYALRRWIFGKEDIVYQEYEHTAANGKVSIRKRYLVRPGFVDEARQIVTLALHLTAYSRRFKEPPTMKEAMLYLNQTSDAYPKPASIDVPEAGNVTDTGGLVHTSIILGGVIVGQIDYGRNDG